MDKMNSDLSKKMAVVLMSGGVDSSAAALLLLREGWSVAGLTMETSHNAKQPAVESAAEVCGALAIPHLSVNIADEFKKLVITPFCEAYKRGETPNPCADCNELVKFGLLWDIAAEKFCGDVYIATGHYARIVRGENGAFLARAANKRKDQSYFLSGIRAERIQKLLLPLGGFATKDETRKIAADAGLPVAVRPESMEICFADESDYRAVINAKPNPGPVCDTSGRVVGTHNGTTGYTLGQRRGLGIAAREPLFVVEIRPADNTIVVAQREAAFTSVVNAVRVSPFIPGLLAEGSRLCGKIRSQGEPAPCSVISYGGGNITVRFDSPVFAPAPGQRLALYTDCGLVAAGGTIIR